MPAIPVSPAGPAWPSSKNPCFAHGCSVCCYETEMPLSESDIQRLEKAGHARADFAILDPTGYVILKNVPSTNPAKEGHHCTFLKDDKCSVYDVRPEGCRWYPVILTPHRKVVRDDECPHRAEFPIPAGSERKLRALLNEMERDAYKHEQAYGKALTKGKVFEPKE